MTPFSGVKCDLMGVGVVPLVELNDPCAEKAVHVQSYHCPMTWATVEGGQQSVNAGVAIKAGNAKISIVNHTVTVNGVVVPVESYNETTVTPLTSPPVTVALSHNANNSILVTVGSLSVWSSALANDRARAGYEQSLVVYMPEQTGGNSAFASCMCAVESAGTSIPVYQDGANSKIVFSQNDLDALEAQCGKPDPNVTQNTCTAQKDGQAMCTEAKISFENASSVCKEGCPCHSEITLNNCIYDFCAGAVTNQTTEIVTGDPVAIEVCVQSTTCAGEK